MDEEYIKLQIRFLERESRHSEEIKNFDLSQKLFQVAITLKELNSKLNSQKRVIEEFITYDENLLKRFKTTVTFRNDFLFDNNLSVAARGLLAKIFSFPNFGATDKVNIIGYDFYKENPADDIENIDSALSELKELGYIRNNCAYGYLEKLEGLK